MPYFYYSAYYLTFHHSEIGGFFPSFLILFAGVILGSTLTDKEGFRSDLEENKAMEVKGRTKASRFPLHLEMFSPFSLY